LICTSYIIIIIKKHTKAIFEKCILAKGGWMVQYNKKAMKPIHHLQNAIIDTVSSDVIT
jgi:hypothetical protein